ncbi:MAG TPA: hypothetical protein VFA18_04930 [Gemmataceae bacterium]|nr:hypothetical protein [Gemmataceae bacterium]
MDPRRWQKLHALFDEALACKPDQRSAFLSAACAGDPELHAEVAELLANDAEAQCDAFLEGAERRKP